MKKIINKKGAQYKSDAGLRQPILKPFKNSRSKPKAVA